MESGIHNNNITGTVDEFTIFNLYLEIQAFMAGLYGDMLGKNEVNIGALISNNNFTIYIFWDKKFLRLNIYDIKNPSSKK
jgi:hypothetical protein